MTCPKESESHLKPSRTRGSSQYSDSGPFKPGLVDRIFLVKVSFWSRGFALHAQVWEVRLSHADHDLATLPIGSS